MATNEGKDIHAIQHDKIPLTLHHAIPPPATQLRNPIHTAHKQRQKRHQQRPQELVEFRARAEGRGGRVEAVAVAAHAQEVLGAEEGEDEEGDDLEADSGEHDAGAGFLGGVGFGGCGDAAAGACGGEGG